MSENYPSMLANVDHIEPVPRRIRAILQGKVVVDTTAALYVWETPYYPQYYIPARDVAQEFLVDDGHMQRLRRGTVRSVGLHVGDHESPKAGRQYTESPLEPIVGHYRFNWDAFEGWYEEDERVYVHPRSPYVRVDALRSSRSIRIELDNVLLAEATSTVSLFETGLPTRYYFDPSSLNLDHLRPSATVTECPYKGRTSGYWSVEINNQVHDDLAWTYGFPNLQVHAIAGLVAFYNEKTDIYIGGQLLERPATRYS